MTGWGRESALVCQDVALSSALCARTLSMIIGPHTQIRCSLRPFGVGFQAAWGSEGCPRAAKSLLKGKTVRSEVASACSLTWCSRQCSIFYQKSGCEPPLSEPYPTWLGPSQEAIEADCRLLSAAGSMSTWRPRRRSTSPARTPAWTLQTVGSSS